MGPRSRRCITGSRSLWWSVLFGRCLRSTARGRAAKTVSKDHELRVRRGLALLTRSGLYRQPKRFEIDLRYKLISKHPQYQQVPNVSRKTRATGFARNTSERRVTYAAITENKYQSAVLMHIKEEKDKAAAPPKIKPASAKNVEEWTGRRRPGWPSKMEAYCEGRVANGMPAQPATIAISEVSPGQAALPSTRLVTFRLCPTGAISSRLRHCGRHPADPLRQPIAHRKRAKPKLALSALNSIA